MAFASAILVILMRLANAEFPTNKGLTLGLSTSLPLVRTGAVGAEGAGAGPGAGDRTGVCKFRSAGVEKLSFCRSGTNS